MSQSEHAPRYDAESLGVEPNKGERKTDYAQVTPIQSARSLAGGHGATPHPPEMQTIMGPPSRGCSDASPPISDPTPYPGLHRIDVSHGGQPRWLRLELIETLLHHFADVESGLPDRDRGRSDDDLVALMCAAWNHASYRQLVRLLEELRDRERSLHGHLTRRFIVYGERRVAICPRCKRVAPAKRIGSTHRGCKIRGRTATLKAHIERVRGRSDPRSVSKAVAWVEERWRGRVALPKAVELLEAERKLRGES